jgi:hypothetical protein
MIIPKKIKAIHIWFSEKLLAIISTYSKPPKRKKANVITIEKSEFIIENL